MQYDFDRIIDRHGTYSTQWDYVADRFGRNDILPFSISDTDFPVPQAVQTALTERLQHPIYGYTRWNHAGYKNSIVSWFKQRDQASIDPDWISYSPSVVWAIGTLIRLKSLPGEAVATFTPMYDAFYGVIEQNKRVLVPIRLGAADQGYQIDWGSLESVLAQPQVKLFLLTNPHNPTGKVFSHDELVRLAELAQRNDVFIISDDIHKDIIYGPVKYTPLTKITQTNMALACSATKSFNTPGLGGAYLLMPESNLRTAFSLELKQKNALSSASIFGITAQMACYSAAGAEYLNQLVPYLQGNLNYVKRFLAEKIPQIRFVVPEGTYLAWLNVAGLGLTSTQLQDKLVNIGRVGIMSGSTYGDSHYLRMNVACPRHKLEEGLKRLQKGVDA